MGDERGRAARKARPFMQRRENMMLELPACALQGMGLLMLTISYARLRKLKTVVRDQQPKEVSMSGEQVADAKRAVRNDSDQMLETLRYLKRTRLQLLQ